MDYIFFSLSFPTGKEEKRSKRERKAKGKEILTFRFFVWEKHSAVIAKKGADCRGDP